MSAKYCHTALCDLREFYENNWERMLWFHTTVQDTFGSSSVIPYERDDDWSDEQRVFYYHRPDEDPVVLGYLNLDWDRETNRIDGIQIIGSGEHGSVFLQAAREYIEARLPFCRLLMWSCTEGAPMENLYRAFCRAHNGVEHVEYAAVKSLDGKIRNLIVFQVPGGEWIGDWVGPT